MKTFAEFTQTLNEGNNAFERMGNKADAASDKANKSGRPEHHRVAANLHREMAKEMHGMSDAWAPMAKEHEDIADEHEKKAKKAEEI
jgi:hypothetical protein